MGLVVNAKLLNLSNQNDGENIFYPQIGWNEVALFAQKRESHFFDRRIRANVCMSPLIMLLVTIQLKHFVDMRRYGMGASVDPGHPLNMRSMLADHKDSSTQPT